MKKPLLYLSLIAAMTSAACTNENTAPKENAEKEVVDQAPKKELVYSLDGEEVTETDVDIVKINNTNVKMILPSSYTYEDGNSAYGNGEVASYSVSVRGKEQYEGTRFYFENELSEDSPEMMDMKIQMNISKLGLGSGHELQKIESTKFDVLYKMIVPDNVVNFAAKTFEGNTHYINAIIYDPEKLGYEDYLLKVLDSIEFVSN